MRRMSSRLNLAVIDFGHSSNSSASQSGILIAIPPAVNRSLNETSLSTKTSVQFSQCPTNGVALSLIHQSIPSVLLLAATSTRIDAIFRLEFWVELINIDGFDIASNGVFHLDTVSRVLKRNPLNAVVVLSNH